MMDAGGFRRALYAWAVRVGSERLASPARTFTRLLHPLADLLVFRKIRAGLGGRRVRQQVDAVERGGIADAQQVLLLRRDVALDFRHAGGGVGV